MSKPGSGLFQKTIGMQNCLEEDYYSRYDSNVGKVLDVKFMPDSKGIEIPHRLSSEQMIFLTDKYGIEFALVYKLGKGRNGGGGKYYLYSGTRKSVNIPLTASTILISHTHPGGTAYPSRQDKRLMSFLAAMGSSQKTSLIVPSGKETVRFNSKGLKNNEY